MPKSIGDKYLTHIASQAGLVREIRGAKIKSKKEGDKVIFHKMIKEIKPNYRFYQVHAVIIKELQKIIDDENDRLIVSVGPRTGKACAHDTPVLTPTGWTTHGELRPNNWVFHPDGYPVRVVAVSEDVKVDYRVRVSNGDEVWCHANHEWEYSWASKRTKRISTTKEMSLRRINKGERGRRGGGFKIQLRNIDAIHFPEAKLIMPPYVLGAWLGDGTTGQPGITHSASDLEVVQEFESYGYIKTCQNDVNGGTTKFTKFGATKPGGMCRFRRELREIGVERSKFIPKEYIYSSVKQRCELIAGLIDTDGHLIKDGRYSISNCNKQIIDSVFEILISLGQYPYITRSEPTTSSSGIVGKQVVYKVTWWPTIDFPVNILRKKYSANDPAKRRRVAITDIDYLPEQGRPGRCIQVDSPDGLYLVGRNLTPTHNSELSSRLLPVAYLLAHPERHVAICSYSAELAESFSREAREYYKAAGGILDPSNTSVSNWGTAGGGGCWATGIGGSVTGRTASLIIADDTVKGREEADSPRNMDKLWSFYQGSLYTRLEPGHGAIVIVATRWSENDLTGRLLELENNSPESMRENWRIIDLPSISEDLNSRPPLPSNCYVVPDWRTEPGQALCPQRYNIEDLERIRQVLGPREWASLHQQRPAPVGGNLFNPDWWQYYDSPDKLPTMERVMLSVDCTFTASANSDYVVGTVIGQSGSSYYLLDMARDRLDIGGTIAMMLRMQRKHQLDGIIIELAANGHAIYQTLNKRVPGLIGYKPGDRSKVARVSGIVPIVEAGNVFLPTYAEWLDTFINEFSLFPAAKNDDICDSVAQCINYMNQRTIAQITEVHWGRAAMLPGSNQQTKAW